MPALSPTAADAHARHKGFHEKIAAAHAANIVAQRQRAEQAERDRWNAKAAAERATDPIEVNAAWMKRQFKRFEAMVAADAKRAEAMAEVASDAPKYIEVKKIQDVIIAHFGVSRIDLMSARRTANVVRPRQIAMYLAKVLTVRSMPDIGRRFGGRDHTTVLHAVAKIELLIAGDAVFAQEVETLKAAALA